MGSIRLSDFEFVTRNLRNVGNTLQNSLILLLVIAAIGGQQAPNACPTACFCNQPSKIVYCSRRGLTAIPNGVSSDTLQLNLNGNIFQSTALQRANFSGYEQLEHLYLSECGIEKIEVGTFVNLVALKWLDLSNNRIRTLTERSFNGLTLQHLFLNGNRQLQLLPESFDGLVTTGLYLHDCSLVRLRPEVLSPLNSTLRYLWLNGNELDRIDQRLSGVFSALSHLRLGSNPLHCNCEVVWLKEFFERSGEIFKGAVAPSCLTPLRLRGKYFNELSLFDLRCQAPMFNNIETTFGLTTGRMKCTATGDPAPTLYWIQPSGKTTRYNPSVDEDVRKNEGVLQLETEDGNSMSMFGMYICVANNEAGNVTLTINVSWPLQIKHETTFLHTIPPEVMSEKFNSFLPSISSGLETKGGGDSGRKTTVHPSTGSGTVDEKTASVNDKQSKSDGVGGGGVAYGQNYTVIDRVDVPAVVPPPAAIAGGPRLFSVTELVCAIIGTHLGTILICLIAIPIFYKTRWRETKARLPPLPPTPIVGQGVHHSPYHQHLQPQQMPREKFQLMSLPESAYLNGTGSHNRYLTDYLISSQR